MIIPQFAAGCFHFRYAWYSCIPCVSVQPLLIGKGAIGRWILLQHSRAYIIDRSGMDSPLSSASKKQCYFLKRSQVAAQNGVLFHLVSESLSVKLHLFFPWKFALGVSFGIPFLYALVFSNRFGFAVVVILGRRTIPGWRRPWILRNKFIALASNPLYKVCVALTRQLLETGK